MTEGLRLRTFGALVLERARADAPPEVVYRAGKLLALLLHLSVHRGSPLARAAVADFLWGDEAPDRARASLRQAINSLTRLLGPDAIEATRATVLLHPGAVPTDRERFLAALPSLTASGVASGIPVAFDACLDALATYRGPFLAEDPRISEGFDGWVLAERHRLRSEFLHAARRQAETALALGRGADLIRIAALVRAAEPEEPLGAVLAFDGHAAVGDGASARRAVEEWRTQYARRDDPLPADLVTRLERAQRELLRAPAPMSVLDAGNLESVGMLFVGRQGLLEHLTASAERARRGEPCRVLLRGPSGVGKSRLLDEFEARLRLRGARVARVRLLAAMRDVPFAALADATRVLAALPGALGVSEASADALVDFLPELRGRLAMGATAIDAGDRVRRRIEAFADLLGAVADDRFIVLMIDDAQHLDARSRQTIEQLSLMGGARILVLLAARPPVAIDPVSVDVIEVPPFGQSELRALLSSVAPWPTAPWADALLDRLAMLTGGLPQRAIELLRVAEGAGLLAPGPDGWNAPSPHDVVERLGGVGQITDRLPGLPPFAQRLLQVLRVWGRPMLEESLLGTAALLDPSASAEAWREALRALESQGFIAAGWNTWTIAHDSVGEGVDAVLGDGARAVVLDGVVRYLLAGPLIPPAQLEHLALLCGQAEQLSLLQEVIAAVTRRKEWRRQRVEARPFARRVAASAGRPEWEEPLFRGLGWAARQPRMALAWYSALATTVVAVAIVFAVLAWPRLVVDVEPMGEDIGPAITGDVDGERVVVFYVQPRVSVRNAFGRLYRGFTGEVRVRSPYGGLRGDSIIRLTDGVAQFQELGLEYPPLRDIPEEFQAPRLRFSASGIVWRSRPVAVRGAQVGASNRFILRRTVVNGTLIAPGGVATVRSGDTIRVELTFEYSTNSATANYVLAAAPSWIPAERGTIRLAGLPRPVHEAWQTVRFSLPPGPPGHGHLIIAFGAEDSADHLMSATNWAVGAPVWGDGNDLADLPEAQVEELRRTGVLRGARYLYQSYLGKVAHVKVGSRDLPYSPALQQPAYDAFSLLGSAIEFTVMPRSLPAR